MHEKIKHKQNSHCLLMHEVLISNIKNICRILALKTQTSENLESRLAGEYGCLKSKRLGREDALVSGFLCTEENH